jgi:hypothetical protein
MDHGESVGSTAVFSCCDGIVVVTSILADLYLLVFASTTL